MKFPIEDIALVTVTYESEGQADFFAKTGRLFKQVFVIDNHSHDGTTRVFSSALPHAQIIALPKNIGFGPANNVGFEAVYKQVPHVLFLNPDCQIDLKSIRLLQKTLHTHPRAVIACPVIVDVNGQDHGVLRRNYRLGYQHEWVEKIALSEALPEHLLDSCIDGSCLLVDAGKFSTIGAFNPDIFMYYEEDDMALRAIRQNFSVVTHTHARATHLGGASSPATIRILLRKAYHYRWSRLYMLGTHVGTLYRWLETLKTLLVAPMALVLYALLLQKRHFIKWLGWLAASLDALLGTRIFRLII